VTRIHVCPRGRVECRAAIELPLPPLRAWGQLRDFTRFASHDYFHAEIHVDGNVPRAGAKLRLTHRYLLPRVHRVGRLLRWREWDQADPLACCGYSFSDLSRRGPRRGFPHVFSYYLRAAGPGACQLEVVVRGLWTARAVPPWAARLWLWWVFGHVVNSVRNDLLTHAVALPAPRSVMMHS
jgi:hypothetical protein